MRVFCPEHRKGFFAPRQSPIKCENHGHMLGEFNFAGETNSQIELQWQYCCNCEHFCPILPEQQNLERCPVCTRRTSVLYICDLCFTVSFESNTPLETKNFTLTSEGLPQPFCAGCLQANAGEVREHFCDELGASFSTALNSCPICHERLDVGPTFPSLVATYLRKTRTASKRNATFDYENGLFVEIEDGEFVIVTNSDESNQSVVLPRLTHFSNGREFYEIYQDYYHHSSEIRAGEVLIKEPALTERSGNGWKFQTAGLLEVAAEQPKAKAREKIKLRDEAFEAEKPGAEIAAKEASVGNACRNCGLLVEEQYAFCWHCGHAMKPAVRPLEDPAADMVSPRRVVISLDESSTAPPNRRSSEPVIFSSELRTEGIRRKRTR